MNNRYNKKLLSSILVALSLSSGISINDKIANANYKNIDRERLNSLFTNTNNKDIGSELFDTVKNIRKHRYDNNQSSILYNSIVGNSINNFLNNEENKKHYGPDLCKALLYQLRAVHGGHFTVWNDKIKSKIKDLEDKFCNEINCCDAWFWALGGSQKDIDEYEKLILKDYDKCQHVSTINFDVGRTWADAKNYDLNVKEKEEVLRRVLKIYDLDKGNYTQGFNFWCMYIIDKPVGCKNKEISLETEAKIYYVYKTIIDTMCEFSSDMANSGSLDSQKLYLQFLNAFAKDHKNLKLPNELDILNKVFQGEIKKVDTKIQALIKDNFNLLISNVMKVCDNVLPTRNLKIKFLDEIIYAGAFKKGCKEIVQKIADKVYEFIINNYKEIETIAEPEQLSVLFCAKSFTKEKQLNLQFSNDI